MFVPDVNPFQTIVTTWEERRPGPGLIPARQAFDMTDFLPWIGWVSIYEIEYGEVPRFKIRLVGTNITRIEQGDNTGRYLDEVFPPAQFPFVYEPYALALKERRPVFNQRIVPTKSNLPKTLSKQVLPVAEDHQTPDKFINILHYEDVHDLDDIDANYPV